MRNPLLILITILLLSFPFAPLVSAADPGIDYLALGDSLAAGQTPFKKMDKGYPDYLAEKLDQMGVLNSYTKQYAVSGYTTSNVLDDILNDVGGIKDHISNAEIITIDVGANDILKEMNLSELSLDPSKVPVILEKMTANTYQIIEELQRLNSHASIYLMGYYNCLPYLIGKDDPILQVLDQMNQILQQVANNHQVTFVPTKELFTGSIIQDYLPNPFDIHPSLLGYQAIADEFWKWMGVDILDADGNGMIDLLDISAELKKGSALKTGLLGQYGKVSPGFAQNN